jgi:hypothetical protein
VNDVSGPSKSERKKIRRRAKKAAETSGGRDLEALTDIAIAQALALAPEVAASTVIESERVLDLDLETLDAARFIRKRVNEALGFDEWLDEIEVWVWDFDTSVREAMSDAGREHGVELRLEKLA